MATWAAPRQAGPQRIPDPHPQRLARATAGGLGVGRAAPRHVAPRTRLVAPGADQPVDDHRRPQVDRHRHPLPDGQDERHVPGLRVEPRLAAHVSDQGHVRRQRRRDRRQRRRRTGRGRIPFTQLPLQLLAAKAQGTESRAQVVAVLALPAVHQQAGFVPRDDRQGPAQRVGRRIGRHGGRAVPHGHLIQHQGPRLHNLVPDPGHIGRRRVLRPRPGPRRTPPRWATAARVQGPTVRADRG